MALIGRNLAIASVGISCQPAHQTYLNAPLIIELAGETLEVATTPFDWIIVAARDAARMIEARRYYPTEFSGPLLGPKPFWKEFGAHYWHAKTSAPDDFLAKYAHMAANFDLIQKAARSIFIVANTQNNVRRALLDFGREPIDSSLDFDRDIVRLYCALRRVFGLSAELHVVTHGDLAAPAGAYLRGEVAGRPAISVHRIERDGSQWAGDQRQWQTLFKQII